MVGHILLDIPCHNVIITYAYHMMNLIIDRISAEQVTSERVVNYDNNIAYMNCTTIYPVHCTLDICRRITHPPYALMCMY